MFDIFSATGFWVHTPCGPRKSGMPESVEMPAPVSTTMRRASPIQVLTCASKTRAFESCRRAAPAAAGLAAHLLQLLHGALDRLFRELAELVGRFLERAGADLEADRQRARRRQHLRFADVEHGPRLVALAVFLHRRHAADRADAAVREDLLEVERFGIDLDVVRGFGVGSHG